MNRQTRGSCRRYDLIEPRDEHHAKLGDLNVPERDESFFEDSGSHADRLQAGAGRFNDREGWSQ